LYKTAEELKRVFEEKENIQRKMEDNMRTTTLEMKIMSNENNKLTTIMSNFRLENEMLKGVLAEKSEIMSKKEEILARLEREIQQISTEKRSDRLKYEEDIEILTKKDSELQENIHILTLNLNKKEAEISNLQDIKLMEKKELENEIRRLTNELHSNKNESLVEKKKQEEMEKSTIFKQIGIENMEKTLKEKEQKLNSQEKELKKLKDFIENLEKGFSKEIEERVEGIQSDNMNRIIGLEVKLSQSLQKQQDFETKIEELMKENKSLKGEVEEEISEKNNMEMRMKYYEGEKTKLLADFKLNFFENIGGFIDLIER